MVLKDNINVNTLTNATYNSKIPYLTLQKKRIDKIYINDNWMNRDLTDPSKYDNLLLFVCHRETSEQTKKRHQTL